MIDSKSVSSLLADPILLEFEELHNKKITYKVLENLLTILDVNKISIAYALRDALMACNICYDNDNYNKDNINQYIDNHKTPTVYTEGMKLYNIYHNYGNILICNKIKDALDNSDTTMYDIYKKIGENNIDELLALGW